MPRWRASRGASVTTSTLCRVGPLAALEGPAGHEARQEVAAPGSGVRERVAVEPDPVALLVGFQVTLVRGEIAGHGPTLPARMILLTLINREGSRPMADGDDFNGKVIEEFRASGGKVAGISPR